MFDEIFQYKLIYIFEIPYDTHKGLLKIGETTIKNVNNIEKLIPNCKKLNDAANERIKEFTNTAGIKFNLLYNELAIKSDKGNYQAFRDYDVHRVLINSNVERIFIDETTGREWFKVSLDDAIRAIQAVKLNMDNLSGVPGETNKISITLRPEQEDAIKQTENYFKKGKTFLWNAKMRFGKTLSALELIRRMEFAKTIIITHRPVVDKNWYEDFNKIFQEGNYIYGSKNKGNSIKKLLSSGKNFVYFASIQDLRGSDTVGGKFSKNETIFNTDWDLVIVDEAHEGTTTALGDSVIKKIVKDNSKFLALSGTPFNILGNYEDNIYTWDYVMEQRQKIEWDQNHFGDSNPYDELPTMNIFTYNLGELLKNSAYVELEDKAFNFREFFRTNDNGKFIHEDDIKSFLNLLIKPGDDNYPYSTEEYRKLFQHSLWIIPGVKEGKALSRLLKNHPIFRNFEIVNVAGNGDDNEESFDAFEKVQNAINNYDYTITISCGRLTTGVTVPEWTAVFMLAGSYSTSAASYLQTIFRIQTPCNKNGKIKRNSYVFDFAPDRTLKMVAESVAISAKAGKTDDNDRSILGEFLNFCPIIAFDGGEMINFDASKLLQQLKRAYADRVVKNGFDDTSLYNDSLLKINEIEFEKFKNLTKIVSSSNSQPKVKDIEINSQGFTDEEYERIKRLDKKPKRELTDEENKFLEEVKRRNKLKATAISILRAISIRMPLLIYGADIPIDKDFTIEMLLEIDNDSWNEFMPKGVTKEVFKNFIKYYDPEIFIVAGHKIRNLAKSADDLPPTERIKKIAELFSTFKNPDKETVLTPFRVVNIHISESFGGYDFFDENHETILESPRYVETKIFKNLKAKILEINSKTGLYPLYVTYSIYRSRLGNFNESDLKPEALRRTWDQTVNENIFVVCKTPMAKAITKRTLGGFRNISVNAHYFVDLIKLLKNEQHKFVRRVKSESTWKKGTNFMKFDAVVGNPPYQIAIEGDNKNFASPIYNKFLEAAIKISDRVSLIHPARFLFNAGATPKDFNRDFLNDKHFRIVKYFQNSNELFPNTDIKGGIVITYYDSKEDFGVIGTFIPFEELKSIHQKVVIDNKDFKPLSDIVYSQINFRLSQKAYEDFPDLPQRLTDNALRTNAFDVMPDIFLDDKPFDDQEYFQMLGRQNKNRVYKWVRRDYMEDNESFYYFKVFIPKANGSGAIGEVLSTPLVGLPLVGLPLVGSTQTFISVGAFDSKAEAVAALKFVKTKFARAMLGILKVTQDNPPETWAKVPLQDFTTNSDIDWSKSIAEIDQQLYKKYNLSTEEINFIETHVKAMN